MGAAKARLKARRGHLKLSALGACGALTNFYFAPLFYPRICFFTRLAPEGVLGFSRLARGARPSLLAVLRSPHPLAVGVGGRFNAAGFPRRPRIFLYLWRSLFYPVFVFLPGHRLGPNMKENTG